METRQAKGRTASNIVQFRICAFPWRRVRNARELEVVMNNKQPFNSLLTYAWKL
jgi:hypothetical protein